MDLRVDSRQYELNGQFRKIPFQLRHSLSNKNGEFDIGSFSGAGAVCPI